MSGDPINYEELAQKALRNVVRDVLIRVEKDGLPTGDHHFYIAFNTHAEGVSVSKRLHEQYPEEMTIVLQYQFWDLKVFDDKFEVHLSFNNITEHLIVPFEAVKVFFDPSVPYGLQFGVNSDDGEERQPIQAFPGTIGEQGEGLVFPAPSEPSNTSEKNDPPSNKESDEHKSADIVELDRFRKK